MPRKKTSAKKPPAAEFRRKEEDQGPRPRPSDPFSILINLLTARFSAQSEVLDHLRSAELEFLKALRALLDKQIAYLEARAESKRPRVQKVSVE